MTTTRTIKAAVLLGIVALWASAAMRGVAVERAAHAKDATVPAASKSKSPPRALIFLWMGDLKERGLLDTTLIVWGGEFGRTPRITAQMGRDHWPHSFSVVLAGGGIKGGQVVGSTDRTGAKVAERPVTVPELMATICAALGVDPARRIPSTQGVLIPIVEDPGQPIQEILPAKAAK